MQNITRIFISIVVGALMLSACSSIDCPLSNRVYATFRLAGEVDILYDTLTIATMRSIDNPEEDTVLINKLTLCDSLNLPMSYTRGEDTFYFMLQQYGTGLKTIDTVWVEKENLPHFESVDCNPSMFHTINGVRFTRHAIDSIKVNNNKVTYYDTKAHFLIYFKNRGI